MSKQKMYDVFTIISEPRTGSNYLVSVLSSNNNLICHAEVFHPDKIYIKLPKDKIPDKNYRDANPESFLNSVMDLTYENYDKPDLIGFKYFFDHSSGIKKCIIKNKIPVILLERKNKLSQYSSAKIANKTDQWTSKEQSENPDMDRRVYFSLIEYIAFKLRSKFRFNSTIKELNDNNVPYIHIYYEEMVVENGFNKVYNFLKIDADSAAKDGFYKKQNTDNIYDRFKNPVYASFVYKLISKVF